MYWLHGELAMNKVAYHCGIWPALGQHPVAYASVRSSVLGTFVTYFQCTVPVSLQLNHSQPVKYLTCTLLHVYWACKLWLSAGIYHSSGSL